LTSLLSRRSLYCSKHADGEKSVVNFNSDAGNIRFERIEHTWRNGKCSFCRASKEEYERSEQLETHAYSLIHSENPEEIFNMKFDVIIGNPPYQLDTGGSGRQATPIYNQFVEQAKKMSPRHLVMITPSRWFAGGMGLEAFRESMLHDKRISHMVDFTNAKDCFPGTSISGGVNYFLWQRDYKGPCEFTSIHHNTSTTQSRYLDEFPVLIRYNEAVSVLRKVGSSSSRSLSTLVSSINPFGFPTSARGTANAKKGLLTLYSSAGVGYVERKEVVQGKDLIDRYKVMVSQTTSEHAGEPGKDGTFRLLSTVQVLKPGEICTFSYITIGSFETEKEALNLKSYLETKFARFLILQAVSSIHLSRDKFQFLPTQDFSKECTDEFLFKTYGLTSDEASLINAMIRPMPNTLF
jgi:hypothetical protein